MPAQTNPRTAPAYNGPVATKKKPALKNKWIKIRADEEDKELFRTQADREKLAVSQWASFHLREYCRQQEAPSLKGQLSKGKPAFSKRK